MLGCITELGRPNDNLAKMAETLADEIEGSNTADIALELRALYWVSDIAALLSEHIGDKAMERGHRAIAPVRQSNLSHN